MIGNSVLREVVGADFFGAHGPANSLLSGLMKLLLGFLLLELIEF